MSYQVKVCGITRASDATGALSQGVDYLGVNRWPGSPRCVSDIQLPALFRAIPSGRRVYVDVVPSQEKLADAKADGFDFFQIHFDATDAGAMSAVAAWENIAGRDSLWLAPRVPPGTAWPEWCLKHASTLLCDGFHATAFGGTGRAANWAQFAELKKRHRSHRWLLAGGLSPATLDEAIRASEADFFDLNSGIEDAPGLKNVEKLAAALAILGKNRQSLPPNPAST